MSHTSPELALPGVEHAVLYHHCWMETSGRAGKKMFLITRINASLLLDVKDLSGFWLPRHMADSDTAGIWQQ